MPTLTSQHDTLAVTLDQTSYTILTGRVLRKTANSGFVVLVHMDERIVRCAASCLLVPEAGDLVLLAANPVDSYILAVLERPGSAPAVIAAKTQSATLILSAQNLVLQGGETIEVASPQTDIRSGRFTIVVEALSMVARILTQTLGRWQSSARNMDVVATDIATKAARRVTIIDETDTIEAGAILQKVEAATVTNAQAVVITADEDLRLDGTRVTVG
jgi:hypothetical protein